jgi:hemolysin activation/secretion protein
VAFCKIETTAVHRAVACLFAVGLTSAVWAADPPNAGQGLESLPPVANPARGEIEPLAAPVAPAVAKPKSTGPTVRVQSFVFSGNTVLSSDVLSVLLAGYQGRDLTIDELTEATEVIQSLYRSKGYFLAQALLPSQKPVGGVVAIQIVEGQVGKATVTVQPGTRISQSQADGYMSLLPPGTLITERAIERPLLLLNDLPGVAINSVLKPGATPGSADLAVDMSNKGNAVGGSLFFQNHSSKFTGQYRFGFDIETRSVLGFGEVMTLTAMQSSGGASPDGETKVARLGLTLPVGNLGTKVAFGYTDFEYEVGGPFANTLPVGIARVASMLVQHPYIRSRNATHFFHAGFDHKLADDRLSGGSTVLARRELKDYHLGLNGDFRDTFGGGGLNSYNVRLTFGDNSIKNATALAADQSAVTGLGTQGSFSKVRMDYLRLQKLNFAPPGSALMFSARGQMAMSNLDGSEKMSLGGPNGVRSYSVGAASADEAFLATIEYRYTIPGFVPLGGAFTLSSFYDVGSAKLNHKPAPSTTAPNKYTLSALGFGMNWVKRDNFQVRLDVASRVGSEMYKGDADQGDTRGWVSLQKWF